MRIKISNLNRIYMKSQAPTSILILEYDQTFNKFRVINRTEIESSEFTFDKAVKKIIDLNAIYNPSYIYIDRGSGEKIKILFRG